MGTVHVTHVIYVISTCHDLSYDIEALLVYQLDVTYTHITLRILILKSIATQTI